MTTSCVIRLHLVRVGDEEEPGGGDELEQGGDDADDEVAGVQERQNLGRDKNTLVSSKSAFTSKLYRWSRIDIQPTLYMDCFICSLQSIVL